MKSIRIAAETLAVMAWTTLVPVGYAEDATKTATAPRIWSEVEVSRELPTDLVQPAGKTRWDLRGLESSRIVEEFTETVPGGDSVLQIETARSRTGLELRTTAWTASVGSFDAKRWLLPHTVGGFERAGVKPTLHFTRKQDDEEGVEFSAHPRRLGVGWLLLDSGRFEVFLERSRLDRRTTDGRGFSPEVWIDRWIEPRIGVVAEVTREWGGETRHDGGVRSARVLERVERGPGGLKIYSDQVNLPSLTRLAYGFDRGSGLSISTITPDAVTTMSQLTALGAWDFSGTTAANAVAETASTAVDVNQDETCNFDQCGFNLPNVRLSREDKNFDDLPNLNVTLSVIEEEQRPSDVTLWLRAGARNEGEAGAFGDGETRLCYTGGGRTEVPLWRFSNQDAGGFYFANGDSWASGTFNCEQNINNHVCPNSCGLFCPIYTGACSNFAGNQRGAVIGEGPVTLPSGHTFMASVVYNVAEFCVYLGSSCGLPVDNARTATYLWQVPYLGTVARLMSEQVATPNEFDFTTLDETDIKYGLFPPVSMLVDATADNAITISWDPGQDTRRIDGYKVYWDTDSGGDSSYAFNSFDQALQVEIAANSAIVSGLTENTEYFFTVTALSDYTDPASGVMTQYESLVFPTTVATQGTPLPIEVNASTTGGTCTPTAEVTGLTVNPAVGDQVEICWNATADVCADGYTIRGASSPSSDTAFSETTANALVTCRSIATTSSYFLVHSQGSGGDGPWGHFGR